MTVACALTLLLVAAAMVVVRIEGFALKAASTHQMRSTLQMNMFERMAKVVSSNVNSVIRNLEDPEKVAIHSLQHAHCLPYNFFLPFLPSSVPTFLPSLSYLSYLHTFMTTKTAVEPVLILLLPPYLSCNPHPNHIKHQHHPLHHQHHSFAPPTSLLCTTLCNNRNHNHNNRYSSNR